MQQLHNTQAFGGFANGSAALLTERKKRDAGVHEQGRRGAGWGWQC